MAYQGWDRQNAVDYVPRITVNVPTDDETSIEPHHADHRLDEGVGKALGIFSMALGLVMLFAPRELAQTIGLRPRSRTANVIRVVGVREVAAGIGILTQRTPVQFIGSRIAGDVMDLALMGSALNARRTDKNRLTAAIIGVTGIALLDLVAALRLGQVAREQGNESAMLTNPQPIRKSITINSSAGELYEFWRDFGNLPSIMPHLKSIELSEDGRRSHWVANAPAGMSVEWDAEIIQDVPNELIAWRSLEGSQIKNAGSVRFVPAPGNRGTEIHVEMLYDAPGGKLGTVIAKLFGEEPDLQIADALRAFKQIVETGEIVRTDAGEIGKRLAQRPAQPREEQPTPQETTR